jgi:alkaline phosphatase D
VHYTSANYYDPSKAAFQDFDPFWEFVSGPLNAGAFPASPLDDTFGPQAVFTKAPPAPNSSPLDDYQFFGQVDIDGKSEALTVTLKDKTGASLWDVTLERT